MRIDDNYYEALKAPKPNKNQHFPHFHLWDPLGSLMVFGGTLVGKHCCGSSGKHFFQKISFPLETRRRDWKRPSRGGTCLDPGRRLWGTL